MFAQHIDKFGIQPMLTGLLRVGDVDLIDLAHTFRSDFPVATLTLLQNSFNLIEFFWENTNFLFLFLFILKINATRLILFFSFLVVRLLFFYNSEFRYLLFDWSFQLRQMLGRY